MSAKKTITMYLYTRYERFWHWLQMVLIFVLLVTGFEVHGTFPFLGFDEAVDVHNTVGPTWLVAFAFFMFWVFTTGEWKQYIPTTKKMFQVVRYYSYGIFRGERHPVPGSAGQPPGGVAVPVARDGAPQPWPAAVVSWPVPYPGPPYPWPWPCWPAPGPPKPWPA